MWHEKQWKGTEYACPIAVRFYVEKVRANTRTFMLPRRRFVRMRHPDLIFVTVCLYHADKNFKENGVVDIYAIRYEDGKLLRLNIPHTFYDGTICVGQRAQDQIVRRVLNGEPPELASTFFNTTFKLYFEEEEWREGREIASTDFIPRMWKYYQEFRDEIEGKK